MLTLPTTVNNANLPYFETDEEIIRNDAGYLAWFTADDQFVAKSGDEITTFYDRYDENIALTAVGSSNRAQLVPKVFGNATWAAARFNTDQSTIYDNYSTDDIVLPTDHAASFAWIGAFDTLGINQAIFGRYSSTTSRILLQLSNSNKPRMLAKNFYAEGAVVASATPMLLIGSFNGNLTTRLWQTGLITTGTATTGDTHTGNLVLGEVVPSINQASDMDLGELILFDRDILADADDAALAAIIRLASQVYGCVVE